MLPEVVRLALRGFELKLAAGCALVLLALAERALTLGTLTRGVQSGAYTREEGYRRYRKSNRRSGAVFGAALVLIAAFAFNPPFLGTPDELLRQLGLLLCAYALAYVLPVLLLTMMGEWLLYPTLRAELHPRSPAPGAHFRYVCKLVLLQQLPTVLLLEGTGVMYVFALYNYRWALPAGAIALASLRALASTPLYALGKRELPLAQTEWAALGPRIQGWAALADVRVQDIRVEYLGDSGLANAAAAGLWRHTLYLGADLLANTDWRQRDAVIGHELGHIRLGHMRANAAMSLLKAGLAAGTLAYLDVQGIALAIVRQLHPDLAPSLNTRFGPPSYWPLVSVVLAYLWLLVQQFDRFRRHHHELACDRFSVGLAGDPLAKALVLVTIHKLAGTTLNTGSYTHPSAAERIRAVMWMLSQPAPFAPWAHWPVPAIVTFAHQGRTLTVPLASAPPIAPLPPAPWSRIPPLPAQPAPALVIAPGAGGAGPSAADAGGAT